MDKPNRSSLSYQTSPMIRYSLFLAIFFGIISCNSNQPVAHQNETDSAESKELVESPICLDITKLRNVEDTNLLTQTNIVDFKLNEGCICITYEYSGCNTGEPMIVWDGTATKHRRPTVHMTVYVKETGMCDQLLRATTCFSMTEMESLGTQVLVYLNGSKKNFLINYQEDPLKID